MSVWDTSSRHDFTSTFIDPYWFLIQVVPWSYMYLFWSQLCYAWLISLLKTHFLCWLSDSLFLLHVCTVDNVSTAYCTYYVQVIRLSIFSHEYAILWISVAPGYGLHHILAGSDLIFMLLLCYHTPCLSKPYNLSLNPCPLLFYVSLSWMLTVLISWITIIHVS